jgi:hypothetical protein
MAKDARTAADEAVAVANDAVKAFDEGLHTLGRGLLSTAALATGVAKESYGQALQALQEAKVRA